MAKNNFVKILAKQIEAGALCTLITPYGEPEEARFVGTGNGMIGRPVVPAWKAVPTLSTTSDKRWRFGTCNELYVGEVVMFLQAYCDIYSVVLRSNGYWLIKDKCLEPATSRVTDSHKWNTWLEKFKQDIALVR